MSTVESLRGTRRRGDALLTAIYAAVLDELAESGYAALSIERVAERARTGKASIYRRWPTRLELVLDTLDHTMPAPDDPPDTGNVRDDLLAVMRRVAVAMNSRVGEAARMCLMHTGAHDELATAVRERLLPPRRKMVVEILRRGATRGEVRREVVNERIAEVGPMLLQGELMQRGAPITDEAVVAIVDDVLVPLVRP